MLQDRQAFLAAFDALHRELRLLLAQGNADFDACLRQIKEKRRLSREDHSFLDQCREVRNFVSHTNDALKFDFVSIDIDPSATKRIEQIRSRFAEKLLASKFAIPLSKILTGGMEDHLEPLMHQMREKEFSHVPVVDKGVVVGVFDERVLFRALSESRIDSVTPKSRIRDVVAQFTFDQVESADFGVIFAPRQVSVAELRQEFDRRKKDNDRISLILLTERGHRTEKLLSLLTIWDMPFEG